MALASVVGLLIFAVILLWLVMSAPIGQRTVRRRIAAQADPARLWEALFPFGSQFDWNGAVTAVARTGQATGRMVTSHMGRDGRPIEREFIIEELVAGERFTLRYTDDTSLEQSFWDDHSMTVRIARGDKGTAIAEIAETDRYSGIAFLMFRFFLLRRTALKLRRWAETGEFKPGGAFEHPATQVALAAVSALVLWPIFGLNLQGAFLAVTLTVVVGMHELGHLVAFRIMGHQTARVIFLPLLGGIAIGGRPYDRHFEVGFAALMGAGFSAFPVAALTWVALGSDMPVVASGALAVVLMIMSLFNLGNLMPVWKFDGGQVLRQLFRTDRGMAAASFATLIIMTATGVAAGLPSQVLVICGVVIAVISLLTSKTGVAPKTALRPMTNNERIALGLAFAAVLAIHAIALAWSLHRLFNV
ncbi:site-2 protease family protein [Oricola sp.]|uniref:site-2 protease family protein n=1 Tax=Oricola sp. TaxID=1979950 RepID=UPI0026C19842